MRRGTVLALTTSLWLVGQDNNLTPTQSVDSYLRARAACAQVCRASATTAGTDNPQLGGKHSLIFGRVRRDDPQPSASKKNGLTIDQQQNSSETSARGCGAFSAVTGYSLTNPFLGRGLPKARTLASTQSGRAVRMTITSSACRQVSVFLKICLSEERVVS